MGQVKFAIAHLKAQKRPNIKDDEVGAVKSISMQTPRCLLLVGSVPREIERGRSRSRSRGGLIDLIRSIDCVTLLAGSDLMNRRGRLSRSSGFLLDVVSFLGDRAQRPSPACLTGDVLGLLSHRCTALERHGWRCGISFIGPVLAW